MDPRDTDGEAARTPHANHIRAERGPGPGLLSRLPGMAYQCRNDPDWTMEFVSVGSRDLTGHDASALVGDDGPAYAELIHAEDRDAVWREVQAAVEEDRPFELEYRIRTREGDERWVWEQGHPVRDTEGNLLGVEGFITDVTERHEAADERRRSIEMLRTLVDQDIFGVYVIQEGVFRFVNDAFARIFGYRPSEIMDGMAPSDLVTDEDRQRVSENIRRRESGDINSLQYAFKGLREDGSEISVEVHGTRAELHGKPAVSGVLLDVTERESLEAQLRETQKREALAELTAAVAHDFNNFLTAIIGSVNLATLDVEPGTPIGEQLHLARTTAHRAAALTRRLLMFSRKQVNRPETFDLNAVVSDMGTLLGQLVGSSITLQVDTASEPLWVHLDPGHMEQVLMNLVLNARDAMPKGGTVEVRTYLEKKASGLPSVVLEVNDSGHGMDEETLRQIFSPFFTTKEAGTGLGLSTVRRIMEDAKGDIEAQSVVGRGTTFRVRLPLAHREGADVPAPVEKRRAGPTITDGGLILVVEDDDAVRQVIRAALRRYGYDVYAVRTAAEAMEFAVSSERGPDLLLTDISLPDRNGVDVAHDFLERHPNTRVIFASGYVPEEWPARGPLGRQAGILEKPFSVEDLLEEVRSALDAGPDVDHEDSAEVS